MRHIRSLIRTAVVSLLNKDDGEYPTTQVAANDVAHEAFRYSPYGMASHPPTDSLAVVLAANGHSADPIALLCSPTLRQKELLEGEVVYENPVAGTTMKFNNAGDIEIETGPNGSLTLTIPNGDATIEVTGDVNLDVSGNAALTVTGTVDIDAPTVNMTGNLNVTGTITALDVQGGPLPVSLVTHTHVIASGAGAGGSTGPPL